MANVCVEDLLVRRIGRVTDTTLLVSVADGQVFDVREDSTSSILLSLSGTHI